MIIMKNEIFSNLSDIIFVNNIEVTFSGKILMCKKHASDIMWQFSLNNLDLFLDASIRLP